MIGKLATFKFIVLLMLGQPSVWAADVEGELSRLGDATHLEFRGHANWNYNVRRETQGDKTKVVMTLPGLSPSTVETLAGWKDPLIQSVNVDSGGVDGAYEVTFLLKGDQVKAFDYLTDEPSRLILDFYVDETSATAEAPAFNQKSGSPLPAKVSKTSPTVSRKVRIDRAPAGTDFLTIRELPESGPSMSLSDQFMYGIYDGGDPLIDRFKIRDDEIRESAIRASRQNIFLKFPVLDLGYPALEALQKNPPIYEILPKQNEENKVARLLHVLFEGRKHAMFAKTLGYFRQKFPNSEYSEMIGFMEADLHSLRWQQSQDPREFAAAMTKYRSLIERFPDSPLSERTFLLIGYSFLQKNDVFGSLKTFQRLLRLYPQTKYRDQAQMAIASNLLKLNRFDDALQAYKKVENSASKKRDKVEARYMQGDVFFRKKDFKNAVRFYDQALKKYPQEWEQYPNAFFNRAESLFWNGDYKDSLNVYIEFLKRFPSHEFGGYAMTRLGELLEILGADRQRAMGAFLESYFRYRSSPGGDLARVRILSARMKDMKEKELEDAHREFDEIIERADLDQTDQFVTVMVSDGYYEKGQYDDAIKILEKFYQNNPTKIDTDVFTSRIVRNIASKIRDLTNTGKFLQAMKVYDQFSESWLKKVSRLDVGYDLGRSYELAGVDKEAAALYRGTLNSIYSLKGTPAAKERSQFEKMPTPDELNLRLAAVSLKMNAVSEANDYLKEIKEPRQLKDLEQIELVEIASRIAEVRGDKKMATSFLTQLTETWQGQPEMVSGPYLRLAQLQTELRQKSKAQNTLQRVLNLVTDTGKVDPEHHFQALQMMAENQKSRNRHSEAIQTYEELLSNFESKKDLDGLRYQLGDLHFQQGDMKAAEKTWSPLLDQQGNLWADLAREKLSRMDWNRNYSKYIDRIPAMKDFQKREE